MKGRPTAWFCALATIAMLGASRASAAESSGPPLPRTASQCLSELRQRWAVVDSADVSRACGNLSMPWAYRGHQGRTMSLRSFGRRHGGAEWAQAAARLLLEVSKPDSTPGRWHGKAACDPDGGSPVFLSTFYCRAGPTFALMSFESGLVQFLDADESLGLFELGASADSLWAVLGTKLDTDPLLRGARPEVSKPDSTPSKVWVDELPSVMDRHAPEYPPEAQKDGVDGTVMVMALVGVDGKVHDAYAKSGPEPLRDAALDAVWQWEFMPAISKNKPLEVWVGVPVKFSLR